MKGPSLALVFLGLLCLLAVALGDQGGQATASASAVAKAEASGGNAVATATAEATASAGASGGLKTIDPDALAAWRAYGRQCAGKNYNRKLTPPAVCFNMLVPLCNRKNVKCLDGKTEFLDASGVVIARGDDQSGTLSFY